MKKHLIISSGALLGALAIGAGIAGIHTQTLATKAEGEKEVISFNITTFKALNANVVLFNTDKTMPSFSKYYEFKWTVDGQEKASGVLENNSDKGGTSSVYFAWNGAKPDDNDAIYRHFHLSAGTVIYEDDSVKYVLEKDYNFWRARHSGGDAFSSWVWQHGEGATVADVPSFSLGDATTNAAQPDLSRWLVQAPFVKSSGWKSADLGSGNAFLYAMNGSTTYELGYNGDSAGHSSSLFGDLGKADVTTGNEYVLPTFSGFDTTTGTDKEISFYFPKGTLFGGFNDGYRCFLENDYYITVLNDFIAGTTASSQELYYQPVTNFVTNYMHMDDSAYEGEGTGLCVSAGTYAAAKAAYSGLNAYQKLFFLNSNLYKDAAARLNTWASVNGDVIDPVSREFKKASVVSLPAGENSGNQTTLIAVISVGVFAAAGALAFALKKKRHE